MTPAGCACAAAVGAVSGAGHTAAAEGAAPSAAAALLAAPPMRNTGSSHDVLACPAQNNLGRRNQNTLELRNLHFHPVSVYFTAPKRKCFSRCWWLWCEERGVTCRMRCYRQSTWRGCTSCCSGSRARCHGFQSMQGTWMPMRQWQRCCIPADSLMR